MAASLNMRKSLSFSKHNSLQPSFNKPSKTIKKNTQRQTFKYPELPSQILCLTESQENNEVSYLQKQLDAAKENYNKLVDLFQKTGGEVSQFIKESEKIKNQKKQ